jgi:hypothetical protein
MQTREEEPLSSEQSGASLGNVDDAEDDAGNDAGMVQAVLICNR